MVDEDGRAGLRKSLPIGFLAAGLVALAVAALALWWYAGTGEGPVAAAARIDSGDAELVALGGTVYAAHCAACHGAEREGEPDWRQRKEDGTLPAPPHDGANNAESYVMPFVFTNSTLDYDQIEWEINGTLYNGEPHVDLCGIVLTGPHPPAGTVVIIR